MTFQVFSAGIPLFHNIEKGGDHQVKKLAWVMLVGGCLFEVPELAQAQVDKTIDRFLPRGEQREREGPASRA
jgi:hypothetical protein